MPITRAAIKGTDNNKGDEVYTEIRCLIMLGGKWHRCLGKVFFFFCFLKELRRVVSNNPTILLLGSILNRTENVCAHKNEYTGNCGSVIYSTQNVETPMSIG